VPSFSISICVRSPPSSRSRSDCCVFSGSDLVMSCDYLHDFHAKESLQTSATAPPLPGLPGGPAVAHIQTTKPIPFFFRKHRPVMVQFAACQIDVDCLLLLHTYLCMYMLSLYAQICYYSISLLLIHAKKSLCLHSYMPKEIWRILIHNGTSC